MSRLVGVGWLIPCTLRYLGASESDIVRAYCSSVQIILNEALTKLHTDEAFERSHNTTT
jgi:hypothetical protein